VQRFIEKPPGDGGYINGGFFVLDPSVIDLIEGDQVAWEGKPLETLALNRQVSAFRHRGFWQAMDTMRDRVLLEELWQSDRAPWKVWT
jgi:glucose-1-phosphate cytidylyltransferase